MTISATPVGAPLRSNASSRPGFNAESEMGEVHAGELRRAMALLADAVGILDSQQCKLAAAHVDMARQIVGQSIPAR